MKYVSKYVQKFNSLLVMFLNNLSEAVDDVMINRGRDFVTALVSLSPDDTTIIDKFMNAMKGGFDFLLCHNTDILINASKKTGLIDKEKVIEIYQKLEEADRDACWKYLMKLYNLGKKACPELEVIEADFDFSKLNPKSPMQGILSTAKTFTNDPSPVEGSMIDNAFVQITTTYLDTVGDCCAELKQQTAESVKMIDETDKSDQKDFIIKAMRTLYDEESAQGLVVSTETTLRQYGLPLVGGADVAGQVLDGCENADAIISAAMQLGTLFVTLHLDTNMLKNMESLASKFCKKVQNGEIDLNPEQGLDPMTIMSSIASSGMSSDIMALFSQM
jgi:hypothetical protein